MKPIRLTAHAAAYIEKRGFSTAEVEEAIRQEGWAPAERERLACRRDFAFNGVWSGKRYGTKQVRPIFVEEPDEIVVVTVYVYSF